MIEIVFYTRAMPARDIERLIIARLTGTALRHARHDGEDPVLRQEAVAESAGGRGDLLAEVAGISAGAREGAIDGSARPGR
jgi:hypothetical protein